jgi:WD40 repeat protein
MLVAVGLYYGEMEDGGDANQALVIWSVASKRVERIVKVATPHHLKPLEKTWSTAASRDSRYVAMTTIEESGRLCDLHSDCSLLSFGEHQGWIAGIVVLDRARLIITAGGYDQTVRAWSMNSGEKVWEWTDLGRTTALGASPSERFLVLGNDTHEIRVIELGLHPHTMASFRIDSPIESIDVHEMIPLIAVGDVSGRLHVLCVENCDAWLAASVPPLI